MQKIVQITALAIVFVFAPGLGLCAGPMPGDPFPDLTLSRPGMAGEAGYLGLDPGRLTFRLSDIDADVLIINVYGYFCIPCRNEAPKLNRLYEMLNACGLNGRIKIIGISAGDAIRAVDKFQQEYRVKFPLFPDADYSLHEAMGSVLVPYFYVVKKQDNGGWVTVYAKEGAVESAQAFLSEVLEHLGLFAEASEFKIEAKCLDTFESPADPSE